MALSDRLGTSQSKEQFAFIYRYSNFAHLKKLLFFYFTIFYEFFREDRVTVMDFHQYSDPGGLFERPPFSVLVSVDGKG